MKVLGSDTNGWLRQAPGVVPTRGPRAGAGQTGEPLWADADAIAASNSPPTDSWGVDPSGPARVDRQTAPDTASPVAREAGPLAKLPFSVTLVVAALLHGVVFLTLWVLAPARESKRPDLRLRLVTDLTPLRDEGAEVVEIPLPLEPQPVLLTEEPPPLPADEEPIEPPLPVPEETPPEDSSASLLEVLGPEVLRQRIAPEASPAPRPPVVEVAPQPVRRPRRLSPRPLVPIAQPETWRYYPWEARVRGIEGVVQLELTVGALGRVLKVALLASSGHSILDEAALRLAYEVRFAPGASGSVYLPIPFRLID